MNRTSQTPERPVRSKRLLVGAVVAAFALGGSGIWLNSALAGEPPAPRAEQSALDSQSPATRAPATRAPATPSRSPGSTDGSPDPGPLTEKTASRVIAAALALPIAEHETEDELDARLADLAVGNYLLEVEAQWQELVTNGWSIVGTPSVVSAKVAPDTKDPRKVVVLSCLDSSGVTMRDSQGDPIGTDAARSPRALHRFTLAEGKDDVWRVSHHDFPDNPAC